MLILVRLLGLTLASGMKPQPNGCGSRCRLSTANVQWHTLTFGPPMGQFYPANGIELWEKKQAKPAMLSDSTYVEATGVSLGAKNLILFQVVGESHWCDLVFRPSLQCIITCVALPEALLQIVLALDTKDLP